MIPCEQARQSLHPYMDGEIDSSTQLALEAHLVECRSCRAEHDSLRHIVDTVRGARPLYQPPQSLTQRSAELIAGNRKFSGQSRRMLLAAAPAAAVLLVALLPSLRTQEFSAFAAQAHSQFAEGNLALAVKTDRPEVVSEWFRHRLAFHIFVPNYPSEESKGYKLTGARIMRYQGEDVAYLAYTMNEHPISLLVTSSDRVVPTGGEIYRSGGLVFRFSNHNNLKLITWKDRGLNYALVSDVQVSDAQSCVVCHGSAAERKKFENLAPSR